MPKVSQNIANNILLNPIYTEILYYLSLNEDNSAGLRKKGIDKAQSVIYRQLQKLFEQGFVIKVDSKRGAYKINWGKIIDSYILQVLDEGIADINKLKKIHNALLNKNKNFIGIGSDMISQKEKAYERIKLLYDQKKLLNNKYLISIFETQLTHYDFYTLEDMFNIANQYLSYEDEKEITKYAFIDDLEDIDSKKESEKIIKKVLKNIQDIDTINFINFWNNNNLLLERYVFQNISASIADNILKLNQNVKEGLIK